MSTCLCGGGWIAIFFACFPRSLDSLRGLTQLYLLLDNLRQSSFWLSLVGYDDRRYFASLCVYFYSITIVIIMHASVFIDTNRQQTPNVFISNIQTYKYVHFVRRLHCKKNYIFSASFLFRGVVSSSTFFCTSQKVGIVNPFF